jgi:cytochrome c biogenesis protein
MATRATVATGPATDRTSRIAERTLRALAEPRVGVGLLVLVGLANAGAALLPDGPALLDAWPYALLLGAVALASVAAVGVRAPVTWREWRRPGPVVGGPSTVELRLDAADPDEVEAVLRGAGYRVRREAARGRVAIHGVRRGWARFAGQLSHLGVVAIIIGAAVGSAFGSETVVSLFPGDQALLDAPRPGFASAVRLDAFDAEFGPDGRPRVLDTTVTFLRDGEPVRTEVLRVNEPGSLDGYLVHPWSYGPAVRLRVSTLGGSPLLDAPVALDAERGGVPVGAAELPTAGVSLGLALADAASNELGVSVVGPDGPIDTARLRPGDEVRVGDLVVRLDGFAAWVTLMSRSDPGLPILFTGAALLAISLVIAFWLPRRRLTVRSRPAGGLLLTLRGARLDRPADELDRLARRFGAAG